MRTALGTLVAFVLTMFGLSGCAIPSSQGQARYEVVMVSRNLTEAEAKAHEGPFGWAEVSKSEFRAIKVDRYTGETWILGPDGWQAIPTVPTPLK